MITGASNRSAIGTLVDRASRFTILVHLPGRRHTAEAVRDALVQAMAVLPAQLRRSLTWDQGKELALHTEIARALGMSVFFCDPHSPWQRPTNENTNGLLASTSPRAATCACTASSGWPPSPPSSTTGRASPSAGTPPLPGSPHACRDCRARPAAPAYSGRHARADPRRQPQRHRGR